jgi:hypothetical protein
MFDLRLPVLFSFPSYVGLASTNNEHPSTVLAEPLNVQHSTSIKGLAPLYPFVVSPMLPRPASCLSKGRASEHRRALDLNDSCRASTRL